MYSFREQIDSDIREYQIKYAYYPNMGKPEWAFNFWILHNFFTEDESVIGDKIIDYHDMGIDCYEIHEDTNDVYLIQNKYYSDGVTIDAEYVRNDFLIRGITALENGTYKHCPALQKYFTKHKNDPDFMVYLQLYVTNNSRNAEVEHVIKMWNKTHVRYKAQIFYLDDIHRKYFNDEIHKVKNWETRIVTVNKGTILNINSADYRLKNVVDARYVFCPVQSLYEMYKRARMDGYPIFDENIREYLGNKGINKGIYTTLLSDDERANFFYYNNGVTIICDSMGKIETGIVSPMMSASFKVKNPQIVNGCQTVNSIYEALDNVSDSELQRMFADTFVMVKVLQVDRRDPTQSVLYRDIVKYNNSQNSIDEKTFARNTAIFNRMQKSFSEKGFLIQIKQSDKNTFDERYGKKTLEALRFLQLSDDIMNQFGIVDSNDGKRLKLVKIDLSKLLQVILAFIDGGHSAYTKKPNVLKLGSREYNIVTEFIRNNTIDTILYLYMLFLRLEQERDKSDDGRTPIVYYALDIFGRHLCDNRDSLKILERLDARDKIDQFVKTVSKATRQYFKRKRKLDGEIDYNTLIKTPIDYEMLDDCYDDYKND